MAAVQPGFGLLNEAQEPRVFRVGLLCRPIRLERFRKLALAR